jgi:small subunit ribosomal protein S14
MGASDWKSITKQLEKKPKVKDRFLRFCKPKERKFGRVKKPCQRCGRIGGGHCGQYGLDLCRQCFREIAKDIGFKKYN